MERATETDVKYPVVRVRCNGRLHRVMYRKQRLVFLDHPHIQRDMMLSALSDPSVCGCPRLLYAWRNKLVDWIPPGLRAAFKERATPRKHLGGYSELTQFRYDLPAHERRRVYMWKCLRELFKSCQYRMRWQVYSLHFDVGEPRVWADIQYSYDRFGRKHVECITVKLQTRLTWLTRVLRRGAEFVEVGGQQRLVLWREAHHEGGTRVVFVAAGRGYALHLGYLDLPKEEFHV